MFAGTSASGGRAAGINLLDYGCMRTFPPQFIQGVVDLYRGLLNNDRALVVHAYETWGFAGLSNELIDTQYLGELHLWPHDREPSTQHRRRQSPGMYGRRGSIQGASGFARQGPGKVPREFVFMDRAAIGLGGVFLHLGAELNFHRLFNDTILDVDLGEVAVRQDRPSPRPKCRFPRAQSESLRGPITP